jgi:hypothetical protein
MAMMRMTLTGAWMSPTKEQIGAAAEGCPLDVQPCIHGLHISPNKPVTGVQELYSYALHLLLCRWPEL